MVHKQIGQVPLSMPEVVFEVITLGLLRRVALTPLGKIVKSRTYQSDQAGMPNSAGRRSTTNENDVKGKKIGSYFLNIPRKYDLYQCIILDIRMEKNAAQPGDFSFLL